MIGKLGFVPPEARSFDPDDRFNLDSLHEGDGTKVRARKRAKKASPLAKTGGILAAVLVIGLIAGGIYMLTTGDETESDNALTYAAMDKPCTPLDTSALDDIASGNATPSIESSKTIGSKTEQTCAVSLGAEAGTGVDVEVSSTVFSRDAGARNEFKHESEDSEEVANESKIYTVTNDIGDGAFTVSRPWADDTGSSDFSLYFYDANAFVHVRVTIYSSTEVSDDDVSARAHKIANAYMTAWKG